MFTKRNIIFLLIIFLAVFLSLIVSIKKIILENNNNNIEVCIDFRKIEKICSIEGGDIYAGFQMLLKSGINSVLIHEDTLASLSDSSQISMMNGGELLKNLRSLTIINPMLKNIIDKKAIKPNYTYIIVADTAMHDRIYSELKIRFKDDELKTAIKTENISFENGAETAPLHLISVNSVSAELYKLGLGFNSKTLALVNELGFSVVLGISNSNFLTINQIDRLCENIQNVPNLSAILIEGGVVPGYSSSDLKNVDYFGGKMTALSKIKAKFALIEGEKILSLDSISGYLSHMTINAHRLSSVKTQPPSDAAGCDTAIARFMRAVKERNVKLIIFEGLNEKILGDSSNLLVQNFNFLSSLVRSVKSAGFNIKPSAALESDLAAPIMIVIIGWGVLVLYILFFEYVFKMPRRISYLVLISFMAFMLIFTLKWYLNAAMVYYRLALAFMCVIIIPMFTVLYKFSGETWRFENNGGFYAVFYRAVFSLLNVIFVTALLSAMIIGILSSAGFVNGIQIYAGFRFSGILIILFAFCLSVRVEHLSRKIKKMLNESVKIYQLAGGLLFLAVFAPYAAVILNFGDGIMEASFYSECAYGLNYIVDKIFGVCPSYYEAFIGYPFLLLYFYLNYLRIKIFNPVLMAFGIIAPAGIVISACAVNYPLYIIFVRQFANLLTGIASGTALCFIVYLAGVFYNGEKSRNAGGAKEADVRTI